jgi:malonyl CoA-acyl carrier protein transacylase
MRAYIMRPMKLTHSLRIEQKEIGLSAPRGYACMLGYSLGEWSAICASGALPLWDTARLVVRPWRRVSTLTLWRTTR